MKQTINIIFSSIFIYACGIYSFTGASIATDAKTVSVAYFTTTAINSPSSLKQTITEGLKDLILSETNLTLKKLEGDLSFTGEITKYQINPIAIKANETAEKNRLIITIKVKHKNHFNEKQNFESTFSRYRDFNSSQNLSDVEGILIEEITKELLEDVFNKTFVNW